MKSVLLGNGVDNQFGGDAYTSIFILKRIYFNAKIEKYVPLFSNSVSGKVICRIIKGFLASAKGIQAGEYDNIGNREDKDAIVDFKKRYSNPVEHYYEIMMEDWFLLIKLYLLTQDNFQESEQNLIKQGFERLFLDAIYNDGYITHIHEKMNGDVKSFFAGYDNIFTVNYDDNIEMLTGQDVYHLHGDYSVLADSENPSTVLGFITSQTRSPVVIDHFQHCFCNALLDYSGELKYKKAESFEKSRSLISSLRVLSKSDPVEFKKQMSLLETNHKQAYQFVKTSIDHPELKCGSDYHFNKLKSLQGEIDLIGLSPNNDEHIFRCLNESNLDKVVLYYYSENENVKPPSLTKPYEAKPVDNLWESLGSKRVKQNYKYPIPDSSEADKIIEMLDTLSFDEVTKKQTKDGANYISPTEANRLCSLIAAELNSQKKIGALSSEEEWIANAIKISLISLREGYLPSSVLLHYIMYLANKRA